MVSIGYHYLDVGVGASGQPVADDLPDSWQLEYFGVIGLDTNADFDGTGLTIGQDYQQGIDPNVVTFNLPVSNRWVNTTNVSIPVAVAAGVPIYMATLLDDTNFSGATWTPFNSNPIVNLGTTEGWHTVWIGVRGFPTNAQQTWNAIRLKLDLTPPVLVITNPIQGIVTAPYIQVQGYSLEDLGSVSYDLNNSNGLQTNQPGFVTVRQFDTNVSDYTTNGFQCFSVPLAVGTNTITLHAIDWAGNATVTNLTYNFQPSANTNPPVLTLGWPQNGAYIAGTNFQGFGTVSDPFATVTAQIIGAGATNLTPASVEMNGAFWLQYLPLSAGTNYLTITATNSAGYGVATNIEVVQSDQLLTIDSVTFDPASQTATVSGTIGDTNEVVLVNGVAASNDSSSNWTAEYVPVGNSGTAGISADATQSGTPAAGDAQVEDNAQRSGGLLLVGYQYKSVQDYSTPTDAGPTYTSDLYSESWTYGAPGEEDSSTCNSFPGGWDEQGFWHPASSWFTATVDKWGSYGYGTAHDVNTNACGDMAFFDTYTWGPDFPSVGESADLTYPITGWETGTGNFQTQQTTMLESGGQGTSSFPTIWVVSVGAWDGDTGTALPSSTLTVAGQTPNSLGYIYLPLAPNAQVDVSPHSGSSSDFTYGISAFPNTPQIQANGITLDPVATNATFCVGQLVVFTVWPPPAPPGSVIYNWTLPAGWVNSATTNSAGCIIYTNDTSLLQGVATNSCTCWYVNGTGGTASVGISIKTGGGSYVETAAIGKFAIYRPTITTLTNISAPFVTNAGGYLSLGNGNIGDMSFDVYLATSVSGSADFTQLINRNAVSGGTLDTTSGQYWLDTVRFYESQISDPNRVLPASTNAGFHLSFSDGPEIQLSYSRPLYYTTSTSDQFIDYVVFRPGGSHASTNIYVTIGKATWSWSGSTTYSNES